MTIPPFRPLFAEESQAGAIDLPPSAVTTTVSGDGTDSDVGEEIDFEGWLLSRPDDGIGEWSVQKEESRIIKVIGDSSTRLDLGVPPVGSWVKVRGIKNPDESVQATRIRVNDYEADDIVIRLQDNGVLSSTVAARYGLVAVETLLQSGRIFLFHIANSESGVEHVLETIQQANDADVLWAEYNFVGSAPGGNPFKVWGWGGVDPSGYENQFAFDQVNLDAALQHYQGTNIKVAVLDTGVALTHTALLPQLIAGWDMVADDATPADEGPGFGWGHGTHVAGIVRHIAPNAQIMPVRVLDQNGRGNTFTLAYAIDWAVNQGADVINLSLGTPFYSQVLADSVANAIDKGVIVVAAAGNNDSSEIQYPAGFENVISVGAVDSGNHRASFSNHGEWIDVAAPGLGITSTIIGPQGLGYASWSGTSMATGFVSGAVALMAEKDQSATASTMGNALKSSGLNIDDLNPQKIGRLLNISVAVEQIGGSTNGTPTPTSTTPQPTVTPSPTEPKDTPTPQRTPQPTATNVAGNEKIYLPVVTR